MIKRVTNNYVFKFVGGEPGLARPCFYCKVERLGGMVCVYSNAPGEDNEMYVCPSCLVQGCKESEEQWEAIAKRANVIDTFGKDQTKDSGK